MPIDPVKRLSNYTLKIGATRTAGIVTRRLSTMQTNFGVTTADIVGMESQVRQVCNGAGVATIQYPFYLCFGRELWALGRKGIAGPALTAAAQGVRDKWNYKGFLVAARLDEIALSVFNIVTS